MFKNYLLTALRNFRRNKTFSAINIAGLAIGITSALVIFMIVYFEFSFDKFEKDRERIHRVILHARINGSEGFSAGVPAPLATAMKNELTGLEVVAPLMYFQGDSKVLVEIPQSSGESRRIKKQEEIIFTTPGYFTLTGSKWLAGDPSVLADPFVVGLSKSRAKFYFGNLSPAEIIGKTIVYSDDLSVKVGGIVEDLDENTVFTQKEFISHATIAQSRFRENFMMDIWDDWMAYSMLYVKLDKSTSKAEMEKRLKIIINKYNKKANKDAANYTVFELQPLEDIHFNQQLAGIGQRVAHKPTLYGLLAIGGFFLTLGCINFVNLTTAQSVKRAKEIGIRKTLGGVKNQLVLQFLSETLLLTLVASIFAIALTPLLLQVFHDFIPPGLDISFLNQPATIVFFCLLIVFVSILAGIYPALVLSGFKPVLVLKNQVISGTGSSRSSFLRQSLTVFQFLIAQFFVLATLMVGKQIKYSTSADLGFNKDAVINFTIPRDTSKTNSSKLLDQIRAIPGVEMATSGFFAPADKGAAFANVSAIVNNKEVIPTGNIQLRWGTHEYAELYKIQFVAGRNVLPSDTLREFLINETLAKNLGFAKPADAINQFLKWRDKKFPIVGVMKDFHDMSMHASISPLMFGGQKGMFIHVKLKEAGENAKNWQSSIAAMQKIFSGIYPEAEFDYKFLDDIIASMYERETNIARLLTWATALAIFISLLGLTGLVIYTTTNRLKEIGIRKVLGASVAQVTRLLSADFLKLVVIAFLIAAPLAWLAIDKWLQDFAYRTDIGIGVFLAGGGGMLIIALLTIGIQTIRAAASNPVESLRTE